MHMNFKIIIFILPFLIFTSILAEASSSQNKFSIRMIYSENSRIITDRNAKIKYQSEGNHNLDEYSYIPGHPITHSNPKTLTKSYWVGDSILIDSSDIQSVYTKDVNKRKIMSREEFDKSVEFYNKKYPNRDLPKITYEEYMKDATTPNFEIFIVFNGQGKNKFVKITRENVNHYIAIVVDGYVLTRPVIREEIKDGIATIAGLCLEEEAVQLVGIIKEGLPNK